MKKSFNRSPLARVGSIMLILSLVLCCAVCGSLAKYTSGTSGSDTASVAVWSFEVNDMQFATTSAKTMTFDLFNTVNEADTASAENHVNPNLLAPGTGGSFSVKIENLSDVDAIYTLNFTETNINGIPVQYSLDKATWYDDFSSINVDLTDVEIAKTSGTETIVVYWRWNFEGGSLSHSGQNDTTDTYLGILAQNGQTPTLTVAASLVATQVD